MSDNDKLASKLISESLLPGDAKEIIQKVGKTSNYDRKLTDLKAMFLSLNTTGFNTADIVDEDKVVISEKDKIVEIAAVLLDVKKGAFSRTYESFIDPERLIPPSASSFHYVSNDMVKGRPILKDEMKAIRRHIMDYPIMAYKVDFSRSMLDFLNDKQWLDIHRMALHTFKIGEENEKGQKLGSFKNQELRYWLGLENIEGDSHRAVFGARLSGRIFEKVVERYLEAGHENKFSSFISWVNSPIRYENIPFGFKTVVGKKPEELTSGQLANLMRKDSVFYDDLKKYDVLYYIEPVYKKKIDEEFKSGGNKKFKAKPKQELIVESIPNTYVKAERNFSGKLTDLECIVLDTETTGANNANIYDSEGNLVQAKDKLVEFAASLYTVKTGELSRNYQTFINPEIPIPSGAASVHHISDAMVKNKPTIEKEKKEIRRYVRDYPILAYNSDFDRGMLDFLNDKQWLDVYRMAMHVYHIGEKNEDGFELTSFKQQELRYWLKLDHIDGDAHRADFDVKITGKIFGKIVDKYLEMGHENDFDSFVEWVNSPIQHKTIPFGYKDIVGKKIEELTNGQLEEILDQKGSLYASYAKFNVTDMVRAENTRRQFAHFKSDDYIMPKATRRSFNPLK